MPDTQEQVYIGLGSNLDNPLEQLRTALTELTTLPLTRLVRHSPWYRSTAVGPPQPDYINGVAQLATVLEPEELLDALQSLEQAHHRVRTERWGPRTLDLDILLFGDRRIATKRLEVPHPRLTARNFVLVPLADIAPEMILPDGTPLSVLVTMCPREGLTPIDSRDN